MKQIPFVRQMLSNNLKLLQFCLLPETRTQHITGKMRLLRVKHRSSLIRTQHLRLTESQIKNQSSNLHRNKQSNHLRKMSKTHLHSQHTNHQRKRFKMNLQSQTTNHHRRLIQTHHQNTNRQKMRNQTLLQSKKTSHQRTRPQTHLQSQNTSHLRKKSQTCLLSKNLNNHLRKINQKRRIRMIFKEQLSKLLLLLICSQKKETMNRTSKNQKKTKRVKLTIRKMKKKTKKQKVSPTRLIKQQRKMMKFLRQTNKTKNKTNPTNNRKSSSSRWNRPHPWKIQLRKFKLKKKKHLNCHKKFNRLKSKKNLLQLKFVNQIHLVMKNLFLEECLIFRIKLKQQKS